MTSVPCDWQRAGNKSYANLQHEHTRVNICLFKSGWYTLGKLRIWCDFGSTSQLTLCSGFLRCIFNGVANMYYKKNNLLALVVTPNSVHASAYFCSLNPNWWRDKGLSVTPFCHQSFATQMRCQTVELAAKECTTAVSFLQPNQVTSYVIS